MTTEIQVGRTWESRNGKRTIKSIENGKCYVETEGRNSLEIFSVEEMPRYILVDESQARSIAQLAQAKSEAAEKEIEFAASDLGRFLGTLSPMRAGKARKTLEITMRYRGEFMTRAQIAEKCIKELGGTLNQEGTRINFSDGSYLPGETVTATTIQYAQFLAQEGSK